MTPYRFPLGIPLLFILVGVLFIGCGGYTLYQAHNYARAASVRRG